MLFLSILLLTSVSLQVSAIPWDPTLLGDLMCNCAASCTVQPMNFSCSSTFSAQYAASPLNTCQYPSTSCTGFVYWDALYAQTNFTGESFTVVSTGPISCAESLVALFDGESRIATLTPNQTSPTSCLAPLSPLTANPNGTADYTVFVGLRAVAAQNVCVPLDVRSSLVPFPSTFPLYTSVASGTSGGFELVPRQNTGCCSPPLVVVAHLGVDPPCLGLLFGLVVGSSSPTVTYTPLESLPLVCAVASERYGAHGTLYTFPLNLVTTTPLPCQLFDLTEPRRFNVTLLVADTPSPTTLPPTTSSPTALSVKITEFGLSQDSALCPITSSGFARPHALAQTHNAWTTSEVFVKLADYVLWYLPLSVVSVVDQTVVGKSQTTNFRIDQDYCVASVQSATTCAVSQVNVTTDAVALQDSDAFVATTGWVTFKNVHRPCFPHAPCWVGESQNLNSRFSGGLTVTMQDPGRYDPAQTVTVDLFIPLPSDAQYYVTIDTVRAQIVDLSGNVFGEDLSATFKARLMHNDSYGYFSDANFCRYNDTLFYVPPRLNAWTDDFLDGINATLCALVGDPQRDRMTFQPQNFAIGGFRGPVGVLTVSVVAQIRDAATKAFVGCLVVGPAVVPVETNQSPTSPWFPVAPAGAAAVSGVAIFVIYLAFGV